MEDFNSEQSGDNGSDSSGSELPNVTDSQSSNERIEQPYNLDKAQKVSWQGKEYSSQDMKNMFMSRQDYTRKTQEIAKERQYQEALYQDLEHVKNNPALMQKFKEVYPEKYHSFLNYVIKNSPQPQQQLPEDPRISQLQSQMNQYQQDRYNEQVKAVNTEIDSHLQRGVSKHAEILKNPSLKSRFEIDVINLAAQLNNDKVQLTPEVWDKMMKSVADDLGNLLNLKRSDVIRKQNQANTKGKDLPVGGGIQGQAPKKFKNLRQAMTQFLEEEGI